MVACGCELDIMDASDTISGQGAQCKDKRLTDHSMKMYLLITRIPSVSM